MNKIKLLVILITLTLFVAFFIANTEQLLSNNENWIEFKSKKYSFVIEYPSNWKVFEDPATPAFIFYPDKRDQEIKIDSYSDNLTLVAVYPESYGAEDFGGETSLSKQVLVTDSSRLQNYLLHDNQKVFATKFFFHEKRPPSWHENGFVLGRLLVNGYDTLCTSKEDQSKCDYLEGDVYVVKGEIDKEKDREIIEHMLSSFKFLD